MPRPRGKEAVQDALIQAAALRFAASGITAVSLRDIAQQAQVNHGLIHRHFGSKQGLLHATIEKLSADIAKRLGPTQDRELLVSLLRLTFVETYSQQQFWRILSHLMLEDVEIALSTIEFPVVQRMLEAARRSPSNCLGPEARLSLLLSLGLGLLLFRPYLMHSIQLSKEEWDAVKSEILQWSVLQLARTNSQFSL